jgi:hypothetical protein
MNYEGKAMESTAIAPENITDRLPFTSTDCGFPDPGMLPAWNVGELPDPPQLSVRRAVRLIGPSVILLGAAIGSGEWLLAPALTAKYAGTVLWVATVSVFLQACLNQEVSRYTLATGEPIFTAYMRCQPGSRWHGSWYLGLSASMAWPGLLTNAATAVAAGILSVQADAYVVPTAANSFLVRGCAYAIFAVCVLLVLFGGKVYTMLQAATTFMVAWILGYLLFVDLFMTSWRSWKLVLSGFVNFGYFPGGEALDWALVAGFAAYAGLGGLGNAGTSNYIRDKGWGMGALVGAIPSAVGGQDTRLSHLGMVFPVTPDNVRKFRQWWKLVLFDQGVVWAGGALLGMALPAILAIEFIDPARNLGHWQAAAFQAEGIARRHGSVFWYLTLLCGFWVLFSSVLVGVDGVGRLWSDMIWTGSQPGRKGRGVQPLYAGLGVSFGAVLFISFVTGALSLSSFLLAVVFLCGIPAVLWAVGALAARLKRNEVEKRVLKPLVMLYAVTVLSCILLSALKIGQSVGPDGAVVMLVEWRTTVRVFVFGTIWLLGSAFILARDMPPHDVYKIYYLVLGVYITWICIAMQITTPLTMILISSNIGGFLVAVTALHTLYVNRRFLPHALRPRWWKQLALLACASWYLFMSFMALDAHLSRQTGFSPLQWLRGG